YFWLFFVPAADIGLAPIDLASGRKQRSGRRIRQPYCVPLCLCHCICCGNFPPGIRHSKPTLRSLATSLAGIHCPGGASAFLDERISGRSVSLRSEMTYFEA